MFKKIAIFGEILFDIFPDFKNIGGAPFNVAYNLLSLGESPLFISRLGKDELGDELYSFLRTTALDLSCVSQTSDKPSGSVIVKLENGEPSYEIVEGVAYDFIECNPSLLDRDDILYLGTLALRGEKSRQTAMSLAEKTENIFIDINLRPPHYTKELTSGLLQKARWLKLNIHELRVIKEFFSIKGSGLEESLLALKKLFTIESIILTDGANGSYFFEDELLFESSKKPQKLLDTVGAGDAFSAMAILCIKRGIPSREMLKLGAKLSSKVCSISGAISLEPEFYYEFKKELF